MSTVVTDVYAELDIQDPGGYYGGFKDGRILEFGDTELIASDWRTGEISGGSTYRYRISDYDRTFRRQLAGFTDRYWTRNVTQWLINEAARRRQDPAYCAFNGVIADVQPGDPLTLDVTLADIITARLFDEKSADSQRAVWRRIGDGFLDQLINVSEDLDRDAPEPIHYGRHVRTPDDPPSADAYRVVPTFLGTESIAGDAWYVWLGGGYAPADVIDLSTYVINADGTVTITSVIGNEGTDWLAPHHAGWNAQFGGVPYRDLRSSTYGNDRRYWLIYGKVGNTDPDACAAGESTLVVAIHGIEPNGDGSGDVILDRLLQYKDYTINYLANQGQNGYQSGDRLTSPSWTLIDGTVVPVVDEDSWDDCAAIAAERLPAVGGSPAGDPAGYIGAASIVDGTLRSVIAEWNVSCSTQFSVDRYGRMHVFMLHPTEAIKAAAPLITDQEEIIVFEPRIETEGQATAIPFQTDFDPGVNAYVTTGIYRADEAIVRYERQILGQTRTYPMAPGITHAYHLARLEGLRAQDKPVYIMADVPVGPDENDDSIGYLRNGDYVRYRDFRGISNTAGEIRLGQIQRCGVRVGSRRCWVELLDCEDLIDYDAPPAVTAGSPLDLNETCATAEDLGDLSVIYNETHDTTANATDLSVSGSPSFGGSGIAYHAKWFTFTPPADGVAVFSTLDSNYDTQLAVFSGSCGSLTLEAFNDNYGVLSTSFLSLSVTNGTQYFILAAGYGPDDGGLLQFFANFEAT